MKKVIIGIFAHPDDEAFGPSGTLLKLRNDGYDIHLILLTDGQAGTNPDKLADLGTVRLAEWQAAAGLLGATTSHALHYQDGELPGTPSEVLYKSITNTIDEVISSYQQPPQLSFMSFEPNGITGHGDHKVVSQLTTRAAKHYGAHETWYYCLNPSQVLPGASGELAPRACDESYINTRIDVSAYLVDKYRIIDCHATQRADAANLKALGDESLSIECFSVAG